MNEVYNNWYKGGLSKVNKINGEQEKQWQYDYDQQKPVYYKPQFGTDQNSMEEEKKSMESDVHARTAKFNSAAASVKKGL